MFSSRECVRVNEFQLSQLACSTTRSKVTADLSFLLMRDITVAFEMHSCMIACVWELYGAVRSHLHTSRRVNVCILHVFESISVVNAGRSKQGSAGLSALALTQELDTPQSDVAVTQS